jgi:putative ABC transport system substrate-binding protein
MCVLALGFFANTAFAKKVVVVSGASQGQAKEIGYSLIYDGINEGLAGSGTDVVYQWVDLDKLKDPAAKAAAGEAAIAKARAEKPDVIIVLNDECLKFVGLKIDDIPVIFAWVFTNTKLFPELPKPNVTGVIRRSYAADIWGLANKLMGVKTVALISKKSESMAGVRKYLFALADKIEAGVGVRYKEMYLVDTFEEWEKTVNTFPEDIIYLADTSRITKGDKVMSRAEITAWTVANAKVPVIAATEADVEAGGLYSIVTSEKAIGQHAADVAQKIMSGTPPSEIEYVQSKKGKLVINMKTAQQYKLEIPYDILSSAEKVYE